MTSSASWIDEISMKDLEQNPNEIYEWLRRETPLAYIPALGAYVASTSELCQEIAKSDDFEGVRNPSGIRTFGRPCIIDENGPLYRDLRSMIDPALHATEIDRWVDALVRPTARVLRASQRPITRRPSELDGNVIRHLARLVLPAVRLTAKCRYERRWLVQQPGRVRRLVQSQEEIRTLVDPLLDR
jgi:cytochrome P450